MRRQALKVGVKIMDRIMITDLLKQDGVVVAPLDFTQQRVISTALAQRQRS